MPDLGLPARPRVIVGLGVFIVALAVRVAFVLRTAGFPGNYGYDSGVYYAAADALIHGRVPYRDFVLLHPPGLMLALTPSALLGRLTTDHIGFASANIGFTVVGAVNAVLVTVVAQRFGVDRRGAAAGGLFYAVWFGAGSAEFLARLEPLGNLLLLLGLLALADPNGPAARIGSPLAAKARYSPRLIIAGVMLGLAVSVKIWFVAPLALIVIWTSLIRPSRTAAMLVLGGAAAACAVLDGTFLLLSRGVMWSRVVTDQLGRPRAAISLGTRLMQLTSLDRVARHVGYGASLVLLISIVVVAAGVIIVAWRLRAARLFTVLAVIQIAILLVAPSWFGFYADFAAVPVSLVVAAAASATRYPGHLRARLGGWFLTAAAAAATTSIIITGTFHATSSWHDTGGLIAESSRLRCVMSDAPSVLIELNALDRDLADGCRNWVDVTGRTYFGVDGARVPRARNIRWQSDLRAYLRSGDAMFIVRSTADGMTTATQRVLRRDGVLLAYGSARLYRGHRPANG